MPSVMPTSILSSEESVENTDRYSNGNSSVGISIANPLFSPPAFLLKSLSLSLSFIAYGDRRYLLLRFATSGDRRRRLLCRDLHCHCRSQGLGIVVRTPKKFAGAKEGGLLPLGLGYETAPQIIQHTGQRNYNKEKEKGSHVSYKELFEYTHRKKNTGDFVSQKAKEVMETYAEQMVPLSRRLHLIVAHYPTTKFVRSPASVASSGASHVPSIRDPTIEAHQVERAERDDDEDPRIQND
ncbi:hypothetical protein Taro_022265 [Colocasia esculenta]|uniref:Uncharacterized protein n=1 Tax=Colocasia esculenta TaxID=4460 RepID=A0A843VAT3_COLES|nr:hypothetical protein [Colocasia esculenta]